MSVGTGARRVWLGILGFVAVTSIFLVVLLLAGERPMRVGSKKFTESVVLGEALKLLIESVGEPCEHLAEMGGSRILFDALVAGDIDAYVEYTGTLHHEILGLDGSPSLVDMRKSLAADGVVLGPALGFNNTYALGMKRDRARELGLGRVSDLRKNPELRLGFSHEFTERKDGWPGLRKRYALPQTDVKGLDHDIAYRAIDSGQIDVVDVYSTDSKIQVYDLVVLEDDLGYFPAYEAVILYCGELQDTHPAVVQSFELLRDQIDEAQMMGLNAEVLVDDRPESAVAAGLLTRDLDRHVTPEHITWKDSLLLRTREHLLLVGISLTVAVLLGLLLGIIATRTGAFGQALIGVVGAAQTFPGLALLALLVPWLGIGWLPVVIALVIYSLLPIVRNTHAGLTNIPQPLRESAEVLGLSPATKLFLVELPLAAPSILAGIKTAAVWNVGLATIGALVGGGGYGQPILTGIRKNDVGLILEGAIPAIVLALLMQFLFEWLERRVVSRGLRTGRH